jgi:hypothetical protein
MSMTAGYACLTCRTYAPNIGDFGLLGAPDIRPLAEVTGVPFCSGGTPSFGYFYEPLRGIGIQKQDLDEFAAWLTAHAGHDITVELNGENEALNALVAKHPEMGEEASRIWNEAEARSKASFDAGRIVQGTYGATCLQCQQEIAAEETDIMAPFDPFQPTAAALDLFTTRWAEPDSMFAHRLYGALEAYTFLPDYINFLKTHRGHPIEVSFIPRAQ